MNKFDNKAADESVILTFDFTAEMPLGGTIASVESVTVTVDYGTDATPDALLNGDPIIVENTVLQPVTGGISGVSYLVACNIQTSDAKVALCLSGLLPVTDC